MCVYGCAWTYTGASPLFVIHSYRVFGCAAYCWCSWWRGVWDRKAMQCTERWFVNVYIYTGIMTMIDWGLHMCVCVCTYNMLMWCVVHWHDDEGNRLLEAKTEHAPWDVFQWHNAEMEMYFKTLSCYVTLSSEVASMLPTTLQHPVRIDGGNSQPSTEFSPVNLHGTGTNTLGVSRWQRRGGAQAIHKKCKPRYRWIHTSVQHAIMSYIHAVTGVGSTRPSRLTHLFSYFCSTSSWNFPH